MSNTITIKHTHGISEAHADLDTAIAALREVYGPETVVYGADGGPLSDADTLRLGRALVWQDEASSVDDDGANAVAAITLNQNIP